MIDIEAKYYHNPFVSINIRARGRKEGDPEPFLRASS